MFRTLMNSSKLAFKNNYNFMQMPKLKEACLPKHQQLGGSLIWIFSPGYNQARVRPSMIATYQKMKMRIYKSLIPLKAIQMKMRIYKSLILLKAIQKKMKMRNKTSLILIRVKTILKKKINKTLLIPRGSRVGMTKKSSKLS